MLLSKKSLKISPEEPKPCSQLCKDVLEKQTQSNILSWLKKRV